MGWFFGKSRQKKVMTSMLKGMLKPILLPMAAVIDATLEGWKLAMIIKFKTLDPTKYVDLFCDEIDDLRRAISKQIKKSLED